MNFGGPEIIIIGAVVVLLFGAKKLPELARSLGQAKTEFERGHSRPEAEPSDGEAVPPIAPTTAPTTAPRTAPPETEEPA